MSADGVKQLRVIGLVGGIASGKSRVAQELARRGAVVLDADRAGHAVLQLPAVEQAARERWGDAIFDTAGHIDRKQLAAIVFARTPEGRDELAALERLTHPLIAERLDEQLQEAARQGATVAVLDAPVLLKAGWDRFCDRIVFVDSPREQRLARARERGWSEEQFTEREAAQESLDFKAARADVTIDNSGDLAQLSAQVAQLWPQLRS